MATLPHFDDWWKSTSRMRILWHLESHVTRMPEIQAFFGLRKLDLSSINDRIVVEKSMIKSWLERVGYPKAQDLRLRKYLSERYPDLVEVPSLKDIEKVMRKEGRYLKFLLKAIK